MLLIFIRTLILFLIVTISLRFMGKRQIGQLQPFELVVAIMLAELATIPMENTGVPLLSGIVPIMTLLLAQIILSLLSLSSLKAREIICGTPTIMIENGKIKESALKHELCTINDLLEHLRIKNYPNISDIEFAVLESNGQLSIIPKSQLRAVTPKDLKIETAYEGLPIDLIIDGHILTQNVAIVKKDIDWLKKELSKFGIQRLDQILLASLDTSGNLNYQLKGDGDSNA